MSDTSGEPPVGEASTARIMDRGYRRYDGERLGVQGAMRSVWRYTLQRVLGMHRLSRYKVLPALMIAIAYVPTLVYVGITVITNRVEVGGQFVDRQALAGPLLVYYAGFYGTIIAAIVLFSAFVAPEVLCTDRRTGMLGLYLSSPLNRWSYLLAKGAAVLSVMIAVTLGPPLVLLIGYSTQGFGPAGLAEWLRTLGRILAAGLAVGAFHTMISLAISSITSRKAAASAAFVALVVGTGALGGILQANNFSLSYGALNLLTLPQEMVYRIFGETHPLGCVANGFFARCDVEMSTPLVYGAFAGWVLLAFAVIVNRYRTMTVTR